MASVDVDALLKRVEAAQSRKNYWDSIYRRTLEFAAPNSQVFNPTAEGADISNSDRVFDSTAQNALDGFVSNLQSSLVPPLKEWIQLKPGNMVEQDAKPQAKAQLDSITQVVFDYIKMSNFDTAISCSFADLALGVGALMVTKGTPDKPLVFTAVSIAEILLEEGPNGRVDTAFRKTKVSLRNVSGTWADAKLPQTLTDKLDESPDEEHEFIEACYPCKYKVQDKANRRRKAEQDGYCYTVVHAPTKTVVVERYQASSPWIIFRWLTLPGELYSRGPLVKASPDIRALNKAKEILLKKASIDMAGIYTYADDGVINVENIQIVPGAIIPVESNGGARGRSLDALPRAGSVELSQFVFEELRTAINKAMFAEPMGDVNLPVKTATEISYRQQELAKKIGSAFGKLQYELLAPLINRILYILDEMELIDLSDYKVDGRVIAINYVSPLAMAQELEELQNMQRYAEMMVGLFGPQIGMGCVKIEEFAAKAAEKLNVPASIVPTPQEFATMKQALQQAVANQTANAQIAAQQQGNQQAA